MSLVSFEIVSSKKLEKTGEAPLIIIPSFEGDMGISPGQMPVISMLKAGVVYILDANHKPTDRFFVTEGYVQLDQNILRILSDEIYDLSEISDSEIDEKITEAQKKLEQAHNDIEKEIEEETLKAYELMKNLKSKSAY